MALTFKNLTLADREVIDSCLRSAAFKSCEDTFVNLFLWNWMYPTQIALFGDLLILKSAREEFSFRFPKGPSGQEKDALEAMMRFSREHGQPFRMDLVQPEQFALLEEWFPGRFQIEYSRDAADYVYERENLANLSGKKYHGKKNHVNKFLRLYPDFRYEPLDEENLADCLAMAAEWRKENAFDGNNEKEMEFLVAENCLRYRKELGLRGACLRAQGRVVAFTMGEPLSEDTFVVHIEKALTEVEGAYAVMNQLFVKNEMEGFRYVNREDDAGEEGLRQAKLSYHPAFFIEKGMVRERKA